MLRRPTREIRPQCPTLLSLSFGVLSNQTSCIVRKLTRGCKSETSPVAAVRFNIHSFDDVLVWLVFSFSDVLYFPLQAGLHHPLSPSLWEFIQRTGGLSTSLRPATLPRPPPQMPPSPCVPASQRSFARGCKTLASVVQTLLVLATGA